MASRLIVGHRRIVTYLPGLSAAVGHFRAFSSHNKPEEPVPYIEEAPGTQTVWPDRNLGPFSPQDRRFPFPGLVGTTAQVQPRFVHQPSADPDKVLPPLPGERHLQIAEQFIITSDEDKCFIQPGPGLTKNKIFYNVQDIVKIIETESGYLKEPPIPTPSDMLECIAQDCPQIMRRDFSELFPGRDIMEGPFTIITISQRTKNDMTGWSPDVEVERDMLLETFIQGATEICEALQQAGFWADFIDPSCGKPFLGPHTNSTLFETDERYRKLGFEIDDLGCCKVIQHHIWGTHSYVGCLFTSASLTHPIIQQMHQQKEWS